MKEKSLMALGPHGFHRIYYTEWGDPDNDRVLICVHGLTRNCRDFDNIARIMSDHYRVICPDVVGRGQSDWLQYPEDYGYPLYVTDLVTIIARSGAATVDWLGTSMGGLIGMFIAAQSGAPVNRLILNDIGAYVPLSAIQRIGDYLGNSPNFPDIPAAVDYMKEIAAPFGPLTDEQWHHLTVHSLKRLDNGEYTTRYDPDIAMGIRENTVDVALWEYWDAVRCPVLLLWGQESDLLTDDIIQQMTRRGPAVTVKAFEGVGHTPMLFADDQVAAVRDWLLQGD